MKDTKARELIVIMDNELTELYKELHRGTDRFENISIKDCPKCKHEVLAKGIPPLFDGGLIPAMLTTSCFKCLTCGSKFICSEKQVCELLDK